MSCIGDSSLWGLTLNAVLDKQRINARRNMTIAPGAMGDTRSVPIMEQSKATTMLRHPTLGVSFMGALIGDGAVSGYRGIPYGTLKKRWTRASAFSHHPDSIFDARNFG
jgi:hypothetical protein